MKTRLLQIWEAVGSSYWFVPSILAIGAILLAYAMRTLDHELAESSYKHAAWVYGGGPEGARAVLSTIAGSMVTIAGVVFSMTLVALTLASNQFGPRLLRNFMQDKGTQIVLGTFIADFVYALLIMREVTGAEDRQFVPQISVSVGVLLGLVALAMTIYFIHHVARTIRADYVVAQVGRELDHVIDRLFPGDLGVGREAASLEQASARLEELREHRAAPIWAPRSGYVQVIVLDTLFNLAREHNLVVELACRPGRYAIEGNLLARVWPPDRCGDEVTDEIVNQFALGDQRTPTQDIEFGIDQLCEIALRALSPGINDPYTAINCIDRLSSALSRFAERELPSPYRYDDEHQLRVVVQVTDFVQVARRAYDQLRAAGRDHLSVTLHLLESIAAIAGHLRREEDRRALADQAGRIASGAAALPDPGDREAVEQQYQQTLSALQGELDEVQARSFVRAGT